MNFAETYRKLLKQRIETHGEALTFDEPFLKNAVHLFTNNIPKAISYLHKERSEEEYGFISEIIDEIAAEAKNIRLIQTHAARADKYPKKQKFISSDHSLIQL